MDDRATAETQVVPFEDEDDFEANLGNLIPDEDMAAENLVYEQIGNGYWGPTGVDPSSSPSGFPQAFCPTAVNTVASQNSLDYSVTAQVLVSSEQRAVTFHSPNKALAEWGSYLLSNRTTFEIRVLPSPPTCLDLPRLA